MPDKIKYAIIENEPLALEELRHNIEMLRPGWQLVFSGETVEDSERFFRTTPEVDLVFMDIELDDGSSFELFGRIEINTPVIFTTAYDEFCLKAFKVNSIDYLLKPLTLDDLVTAIIKFEKGRVTPVPRPVMEQISGSRPRRILIVNGDNYSYIDIDDISWFMSEDKYVFAVTGQGRKQLTTYLTLGDVEKDLDSTFFHRISRKYIARARSIVKVAKFFKGRLHCTLQAGELKENVMISSDKRDEFLQWYGSGRKLT